MCSEKKKERVLYIGGYALPDRNAAAQRVVSIAKMLRELDYEVLFINSLKSTTDKNYRRVVYFGFECIEYGREKQFDYLISARTALASVEEISPDVIIAYNYPAIALNRIRKYCRDKGIRCYADVTEWYKAYCGGPIYRVIKNLDSLYRMRYVHKKMDGIISISRYLYEYYKKNVRTEMIPPVIDASDEKWICGGIENRKDDVTRFFFAGTSYPLKERLDKTIRAMESVADTRGVILDIYGIDEQEFRSVFEYKKDIKECIRFWGRVDHQVILSKLKNADWSIVIRDNNRLVRAGFPSKVVESISCGTPVIANSYSNIADYLNKNNSLMVEDFDSIEECIRYACDHRIKADKTLFDYHGFVDKMKDLMM